MMVPKTMGSKNLESKIDLLLHQAIDGNLFERLLFNYG
jgi:hypothetical protein